MTTGPEPSGSVAPADDVLICVVSLSRAQDRRELMRALFKDIDLKASFFDAVDASDPAVRARLDEMPVSGPWGTVAPKDKACTRSHLDVFAAFVGRTESHLLVLEDDVFLARDLPMWLSDLSWWPDDADIVKLERWRDDRLIVSVSRKAHVVHGRTVAKLMSKHSGACGYLISQAGAQKVLSGGLPNCPIDHLLFNPNISVTARQLSTYQVEPALVVQGNDPESQGQSGAALWQDPEPLWRREMRRSGYEVSGGLTMAWHAVSGQARLVKIRFADHTRRKTKVLS